MKAKSGKILLIILVAVAVIFVAVFAYTEIRSIINSNIKITVPGNITASKLYDLMQRDGEFALPYALNDAGAIEYIIFPLEDNNVIKITAEGSTIQVYTAKDNWWMDIGLRQLTHQWTNMLDSYQGDYQPLLESTVAEIRRITGGE